MSSNFAGYGSFSRPLVVGAASSGLAAARLSRPVARRGSWSPTPSRRRTLAAAAETLAGIAGAAVASPADTPSRSPTAPTSSSFRPASPSPTRSSPRARERKIPVVAEVELASPLHRGPPRRASPARTGSARRRPSSPRSAAPPGSARSRPGTSVPPLSEFDRHGRRAARRRALVASSSRRSATSAPSVAVLLNVTPDHMDRYPALDAYAAAKARIFAAQRRGRLRRSSTPTTRDRRGSAVRGRGLAFLADAGGRRREPCPRRDSCSAPRRGRVEIARGRPGPDPGAAQPRERPRGGWRRRGRSAWPPARSRAPSRASPASPHRWCRPASSRHRLRSTTRRGPTSTRRSRASPPSSTGRSG